MGIFKTFNVADIYPYHSFNEPLYPDILENSRSSFSLVEETNAEEIAEDYMERAEQKKQQAKRL